MIEPRAIRNVDVVLVVLAAALVVYGALLLYTASLSAYPSITPGHPMTRHLVFAFLGVGVMVAVAWVDYRVYGQMAGGLYVVAVMMLIAVLFVGDSEYGSRRWFSFAGQQIQASEVAKLLVIITLARYLADRQQRMDDPKVFAISFVMAAVPAGLVLIEPDMGTALVFGAFWFGMVVMAGTPPRYIAIFLGIALALLPFVALLVLNDYQLDRFRLWIDPASDPLGGGFNIRQAEIGIGSGGIFGKGFTDGTQTQLDFLQTSTTDYIFSVLGEELGLLGALILFGLFTALLFRGIRAATLAQDQFGRLIATGIVIMILFQVFINVAVNIRLVPVTGIPMPFISQGGSSLVMMFVALGLLEGIVIRHKRIEF
ncbi:MAG TPA: rod shape-determining protein RodA [Dehalococcoidia bacterium]|nr:rod shape-determining protein RodA [Dehalococcoidia bacterium]